MQGVPLKSTTVFFSIRGREAHWWEDPTISGDWKTPLSKTELQQEGLLTTDSSGQITIKGRGVSASILVFSGLKVFRYTLFDRTYGGPRNIPDIVALDEADLYKPILSISPDDFPESASSYVKNLRDEVIRTSEILVVQVLRPNGKPAREIPYEVSSSTTHKVVMRFDTNPFGYIHLAVPPGDQYDVSLFPKLTNWPGKNPAWEKPQPYEDSVLSHLSPIAGPFTITLDHSKTSEQ